MSNINGYPVIYMPDREDVIGSSGCVYEHILVAEQLLHRKLFRNEVVHHKDRNRQNNSPENIMVFKTKSDHSRFHKTGVAILCGDVYISPKNKKFCIDCGKEIDPDFVRCYKCWDNFNSKRIEKKIIENRDKIYEMVLSGSTVKNIAESLGLLPQSFSRICKRVGIIYKRDSIKKNKKVKRIDKNSHEEKVFNSIADAANSIGVRTTHIKDSCDGKQKSAYGYYWEYTT